MQDGIQSCCSQGKDKKAAFGKILKAITVLLVGTIITLFILIIFMPIVSLFQFSGISRIISSVSQHDGSSAISLSLFTTAITALLTFIVGTPAAFALSRNRDVGIVKIFNVVCQLPIALPPSVAGIALLLFFGKNGMGGQFLGLFHITVFFTPAAVIIAQFFVSCPLYVQSLRVSANAVPEELFEAAYVNGADTIITISRIIVPMLRPAVVSALIVSYIRSLGEFGATLLFAGNMDGTTSTMPLKIYTLMQSDVRLSAAFSLVLIGIAASIAVIVKSVLGRESY